MTHEIRQYVLSKYGGKCAYCGKSISLKEMQVDHIVPKNRGGGNFITNYNPSCGRCNHYKRSLDLEGFREYIKTLHERISKEYIVKVGIDFGIAKIEPFDGVFYFEQQK